MSPKKKETPKKKRGRPKGSKTTKKPKKKLSRAEELKEQAAKLLAAAEEVEEEEEEYEDEYDEEDEEDESVGVDFDNAGSFDRETGEFSAHKDYKRFFASIDFKTMKEKNFDRLLKKKDFEWFIIGTDATKRKGEDGIFLRLSQSGESFIFYINERLFCIPVSHINSEEFDTIGVSEVTFS